MKESRPQRSVGRVLCLDGDQDNCDLLTFLLKQFGYQVITTTSNSEALHLAKRGDVDLILLDSRLREATGAELCRKVRIFDPRTPILFCSAAAFPADFEAAFSAGADGYVVKPFEPVDLLEKIDQLIQAHRASSLEAMTAPEQDRCLTS
jgi:CheY-like chemotaxis protein